MRHVVLLVVIAACGDDLSMQVRVEHPDGIEIERTIVTVYEAPGDDVRCADIEFQDISETELAGLEVARVEGEGALDGISRVGTKLVVARGFRANGMYFTAGCAEQGTIDGNETVVVQTQIVAAVSLGGVEPGSNDFGSIPITITTPLGAALPRRPIGWRAYGYAGAMPLATTGLTVGTDEWEPTTTTCTGTDGGIRLRPIPPAQIGGYAARVRVSWGQEAPRLFSLFTRAEIEPRSLAPIASLGNAGRLCTPRTSGSISRIVCIENDGTGEPVARDIAITVTGGTATLAIAGNQTFGAAEDIAAVYTIGNGTTRDAYAITRLGRVIGLFNPSKPANGTQVPFVNEGFIAEAMPISPCKSDDPPRLAVRTVDTANNRQRLWLKDPHGGAHVPVSNLEGTLADVFRFNAAGCVTELSTDNAKPISRQVIVVDQADAAMMTATTTAYYDCSGPLGRCFTRLPLPFNGIGFRRGTNGEEDRLVAPLVDATGTVLSELLFLDAKIVERARIPSAALPDHIVSGRFDGDSQADLFWAFSAFGATQSNFQIAYAREIDGAPLTAVTGPKAIAASDLFAVDLTGDGFDDIAIVQRTRDGSAPSTIAVIAARATAATFTPRPDEPCQ